jgi:hypothetical protein
MLNAQIKNDIFYVHVCFFLIFNFIYKTGLIAMCSKSSDNDFEKKS